MEKIRKFLKSIAQFFSSLFSLTSYVETQKKVDDSLLEINKNLKSISENMATMGTHLADTSAKLDSLDEELTKVKDGLQIELFGSLQQLHEKYTTRGWATAPEKLDAQRFYVQIHNLGQDGWSEQHYKEIIALPESKEQYYKQQ